jgi:hypothetical protein
VTIFCCLRFETSVFVVSYDSQGHGGSIRFGLHTDALPRFKSKLCYDRRFSRPVRLGIKHPSGAYDQIFITVRQLQACLYGALSLTRGRVCSLPDLVSSNKSLVSTYNLRITCYQMYVYTTYTRPLSVRAQYSRKCPIISSSCCNSSVFTWTVI